MDGVLPEHISSREPNGGVVEQQERLQNVAVLAGKIVYDAGGGAGRHSAERGCMAGRDVLQGTVGRGGAEGKRGETSGVVAKPDLHRGGDGQAAHGADGGGRRQADAEGDGPGVQEPHREGVNAASRRGSGAQKADCRIVAEEQNIPIEPVEKHTG